MAKMKTGVELRQMVADSLARRGLAATGYDVPQPDPDNFTPDVEVSQTYPTQNTYEGTGQMTSSYGTALAAARPNHPEPGAEPFVPSVEQTARIAAAEQDMLRNGRVAAHEARGVREEERIARGGTPRTQVTGGPTSRLRQIAATRASLQMTKGI
jgi:hypothetical protein